MSVVCQKVLFAGQVQGVGFRRKTSELAKRFAVTGYVRNLPSGHVELVVEGAAEEIARFIDAIKDKFPTGIESLTVSSMPTQQFGEFVVKF